MSSMVIYTEYKRQSLEMRLGADIIIIMILTYTVSTNCWTEISLFIRESPRSDFCHSLDLQMHDVIIIKKNYV